MKLIILTRENRSFRIDLRWGKWSVSHQLAAFEKQLQLTLRQLDVDADHTPPKTSESTLLEPLGVNTKSGSVPQKNLGA